MTNSTHYSQYVGQQNQHLPPLTVIDTSQFTHNLKWSQWTPHVDVTRRKDVTLAACTLGNEHSLDTFAGSDCIREASGRDKKKAAIAELLIGLDGRCVYMDSRSKSLNAMTTSSMTRFICDLAKSQISLFVTSMQASGTSIFGQSDTVRILDKVHILYYNFHEDVEHWFKSVGSTHIPLLSCVGFCCFYRQSRTAC